MSRIMSEIRKGMVDRQTPLDGCAGSMVCRHDLYCVECGRPRCVKQMRHTRLHGYQCFCGSMMWQEKGK